MANDLTEYALQGYALQENKNLYSSPCYYAHALGEYFRKTGRSKPRGVRMSRGYSIRANDMLFLITHGKEIETGKDGVQIWRKS